MEQERRAPAHRSGLSAGDFATFHHLVPRWNMLEQTQTGPNSVKKWKILGVEAIDWIYIYIYIQCNPSPSVTHDCSVDDVGTWSHNYPSVRLLGQEKAAAWFGEILSFGTHADAGKQASEAGRPFDASRPEHLLPAAGLLEYVWGWSTWLGAVPIIRSVRMMWVVQLPACGDRLHNIGSKACDSNLNPWSQLPAIILSTSSTKQLTHLVVQSVACCGVPPKQPGRWQDITSHDPTFWHPRRVLANHCKPLASLSQTWMAGLV